MSFFLQKLQTITFTPHSFSMVIAVIYYHISIFLPGPYVHYMHVYIWYMNMWVYKTSIYTYKELYVKNTQLYMYTDIHKTYSFALRFWEWKWNHIVCILPSAFHLEETYINLTIINCCITFKWLEIFTITESCRNIFVIILL